MTKEQLEELKSLTKAMANGKVVEYANRRHRPYEWEPLRDSFHFAPDLCVYRIVDDTKVIDGYIPWTDEDCMVGIVVRTREDRKSDHYPVGKSLVISSGGGKAKMITDGQLNDISYELLLRDGEWKYTVEQNIDHLPWKKCGTKL